MKRLISSILVPLLLLCACNKQDSVIYTGMETGFISSGRFDSDSGKTMTVVGNENNYDVSQSRRVLITYETHPITDPKHIDIDLLGLMDAVIREPFHVDALEDQAEGVAADVTDAWFSGAYLNVIASVQGKASDTDLHAFSAPFTADENGLVIRIIHESSEEIPAGSKDEFALFLSLPMDEALLSYEHACQAVGKKMEGPVPVLLQWTDYVLEGGPLSLFERKGSYTPPASN